MNLELCAYCASHSRRVSAVLTVCGTTACSEHAAYALAHTGGIDGNDPPTKRGTRPRAPRPAMPGRLDVPH